ncbi:MAG: PDZ domain-containing protein, partial [bacterium]
MVVSDRSGNKDIFLVYSSSSEPIRKRLDSAFSFQFVPLIASPEEDHSPRYSPDGKYIAFIQGLGDLWVRERVSGKQWKIVEGWSLEGYNWSPDSRWIAYAKKDDEFNTDVWIVSVDGKIRVNVSRHPDDDEYPVWSPDGSKLAFRSRRRENNWDIYFVFLRLADEQKSLVQWKEEEWQGKYHGDEDGAKKRTSDEGLRKLSPEPITIDTTDIYRRVRSVTSLPGMEGIFDISPDGKKFAFVSSHEFRQGWEWRDEEQMNTDIYLIDWDGKNLKRLTTGAEKPKWIKFDRGGKKVFYLDRNGRIKSISLDGSNRKTYPFEVRYRYDESSLRYQKFHELWRVLRDRFYDPQFHNRDWVSLKLKYLPWLEVVRSEKDFGDVVKMMLGELNSSHMGYLSPPPANKIVTGRLGLDFAPHPLYKVDTIKLSPPPHNEGLRIAHILPRGPCDRVGTEVRVGEWLTGINGVKITPEVNLYSLLEDKVDVPVELTIWDGKKERRLVVRPCGEWEESQLRYEEWVQERRRIVD